VVGGDRGANHARSTDDDHHRDLRAGAGRRVAEERAIERVIIGLWLESGAAVDRLMRPRAACADHTLPST
jgi:hypothetical protein